MAPNWVPFISSLESKCFSCHLADIAPTFLNQSFLVQWLHCVVFVEISADVTAVPTKLLAWPMQFHVDAVIAEGCE